LTFDVMRMWGNDGKTAGGCTQNSHSYVLELASRGYWPADTDADTSEPVFLPE
jgi:hypothetical protein